MTGEKKRIKAGTALPWFICLVLVLALIFALLKQHGGEVATNKTLIRENDLISSMRVNLLRAAEAEKSSVLAVTDEESKRFADQARLAAKNVDKARGELAPLIERDDDARETAGMAEFNRCWTEFQKLDQLVLDLAVQNTNIQAANLALTKGAAALGHLEQSLGGLIDSAPPDGTNSRIIKLSYQAIVAGLKIHDLYSPHIEAETDEQMDRIEKDIRANEKILSDSLKKLSGIVPTGKAKDLAEAEAARNELAGVTDEIIKLSRKNTNIKSLELSLGKKRLITAQCDEALSAFQELIQDRGSKATR